jgi:3-dehydroquinate dehydratase/shikimate dehydrogenase
MICVSIARTRHRMMMAEHKALAERGAKLVELRIDWLARDPDVPRLLKDRPTPVIVTCRRAQDGGKWRGTEEERQRLLRTAIVSGVDYIDLEDDIAKSIPRYGKTKRIVSHHDFNGTPEHVEEIWAEMAEMKPDIIKLVTLASSASDCIRVLKLVQNAKIPTVAFCMGEFGVWSRIVCAKLGSPFSYAAFSPDREVAPGQLSYQDMAGIYNYESINAETRLFGVIGDPIGHSLSPLLHNRAMRKIGFNGVYVPIRIARDQLTRTLNDLDELNFRGLSVTIPHKEAVLVKFPKCEEIVRQIGAANTLFRDQTNEWQSFNTDYQAALDSVKLGLRPGDTLEGKRVLLMGAGGVARAIGMGIVRAGGVLVICSRTSTRSKALAAELSCRSITWENRGSEFADILINCTPVGMSPNMDETPFHSNWLRDGMIVFDTIYTPENTLLIKESKARGCTTVTGVEMFIRQAAAQFERFTGQAAPLDEFRDTLRRGISAAKS